MTRPAILAILTLASTLAACGGAAEEAKTADLSAEDLATPERAYAAVGRAEGELALALGPAPGGAKDQGFAQPASPPPPPPPPPTEPSPPPPPVVVAQAAPPADAAGRSKTEEQDAKQKSTPAASASPCVTACAALTSMERAADHLCTLAGAGDARCTDARARVESASKRVRAACPACAG
jgi:hypothetical protein